MNNEQTEATSENLFEEFQYTPDKGIRNNFFEFEQIATSTTPGGPTQRHAPHSVVTPPCEEIMNINLGRSIERNACNRPPLPARTAFMCFVNARHNRVSIVNCLYINNKIVLDLVI